MFLLNGSSQNDSLDGGLQKDLILSLDGDDIVRGINDRDAVFGNRGNDVLNGNKGNDTVRGGQGKDIIHGGEGDDWGYGDKDSDIICGDKGNDTLIGHTGITPEGDEINDEDLIYGNAGDDNIFGNKGKDTLRGGVGKDTIFAGKDDDYVFGDKGSDSISGDLGNDTLLGNDEDDIISGGDGSDLGFGNTGNDLLFGNEKDDTLHGGKGDDTVHGGKNNDLIFGEIGNDFLVGDLGSDTIEGGEGDDIFVIGRRNDIPGYLTTGGVKISDADWLLEFGTGNDKFQLIGGITYDDLRIFAGSGEYGGYTIIQDIKGTGEYLAILKGDFTSILNRSYFLTENPNPDPNPNPNPNPNPDPNPNPNVIVGNDEDNTLTGGNTNDSIIGAGGDDIITGGSGNDSIFGGPGNDTISGDEGADSLSGGEGNDIFNVGKLPTGSTGGPQLTDADTLTDFQPGKDKIQLIGGLSFDDLNIYPGTGDYAGKTIIQDKNTGDYLAILDGNVPLNRADFLPFNSIPANNAPTDIQLSNTGINENSANETLIGTLSATDGDSNETYTYTLLENAGGRFKIEGNNLVVASGNLLDYETSQFHSIKIRVTDAGGLSFDKVFTINLNDIDENIPNNSAPTDISLDNNSLDENSVAGTVIGTLSATDSDAGDSQTFALIDDAQGRFIINNNQLVVAPGAVLDFETQPTYTIKLRVTDSGGKFFDKTFSINVNNLNENVAPTAINLSNNSIEENSANETVIGTFSSIDVNADDTHQYTLINDAEGRFKLDGNKLVVANGSLLDYEQNTSHSITIRTTDSGGLTFEQTFTVTINDVDETTPNSPPTDILLSNNSLDENSSGGTVVGILSATDPDVGDSQTFALIDDAEGRFVINNNQLLVAPSAVLDFETNQSHTISVRVTDSSGNNFTKDLTINLNNLDENQPPTAINLSNNTIPENSQNETIIGTFSTTDLDAGDTHTYTLVDDASGRFKLVNNNQLVVADGSLLDYESNQTHTITIRTTDSGGKFFEQILTIQVGDVADTLNSPPSGISLSSNSIAENSPNNSVIGNLTTMDLDSGDSHSYSLIDDAGGRFQIINGNQLVVADGTLLDFETNQVHTITVQTTDSGGLTYEEIININITNVTEAPPTAINLSNNTIAENSANTTLVGNLSTVDPDITDTHTYTLIDDAGGRFQLLNGNQLVVADGSLLDFETNQSHIVTVLTTDSSGLTWQQNLTINVSDINETIPNNPPTAVILNTNIINENSANNTFIGNLSTTDADAGDTHSYSLIDNAGGRFQLINGNQIAVANGSLLDFEANQTHTIVVTTTDNAGATYNQTVTISVSDVNEAPVIQANKAITVVEDSGATGLAISAPTDPDGNTLAITVDTIPDSTIGIVRLGGGGATLTVGQTLTTAELTALEFVPVANATGAAGTFTYTVNDGINSVSQLITLDVTAVDDPPVVEANKTVTVAEDSAATGLTIAAPTDIDTNTLTITVSTIPEATIGIVRLSAANGGTTVSVGQTLTIAELTSLEFVPVANATGLAGTFSYAVSDNTTTVSQSVTLNITPLNDPPVAEADKTLNIDEDAVNTGLTITPPSDPDADTLTITVTSVPNTLIGDVRLAGGGAVVTTGQTLSEAELASLEFDPAANATGTVTFSYTATDPSNASATSTVTINVTPVNDAPVNTLPPTASTNQDTPLIFNTANANQISIADIDADPNNLQITLSATNGTVSLVPTAGVTINNNGTTTVQATGTLSNLNTALNGLTFTPTVAYTGTASITLLTDDQGNTGTPGSLTDSDIINITVNAVTLPNDPPVNTVPLTTQTVVRSNPLVFNSANSNQILIADPDADPNPVQITLTATNGILTLASTTGLIVTGNGTTTVQATGTLANLNTALNGLTFNANPTYVGAATITLLTNDQGNTGTGGALTDTDTINLTITNTPPVADDETAGPVFLASKLQVLVADLLLGDTDADGDTLSITTVSATNGTATLDAATGTITYRANPGYVGPATIDYVVSDPYGGTDTGTVNLTVTSVVNLSTVATGSTLPAGVTGFVMNGELTTDQAGFSVSSAGDVNGDGLADMIVSALNGDGNGNNSGKSYVIFGSTNTTSFNLNSLGTRGFAINGQAAYDLASFSVSGAGDVNGDGFSDLIIGAYLADVDLNNDGVLAANLSEDGIGKAYVVFGKASNTPVNLSSVAGGTGGFVINGASIAENAGFSVSGAGDVNGDGFADVIVGAPRQGGDRFGPFATGAPDGQLDQFETIRAGRSYVVYGKAATTAVNLSNVVNGSGGFAINREQFGDRSGVAVSAAGDVNGDGLGDIIVGDDWAEIDVNNNNIDDAGDLYSAGKAYVIYGKTDSMNVDLSNLADQTIYIPVNAANDAPINRVPTAQSTNTGMPLVFSSANFNQIKVSDLDAANNPVQVTLTATAGTLTLPTIAGLTFSAGDGTADTTMTFTGTIPNINTALDGLTFNPTGGNGTLQIVTNDQGNIGGAALTDTDTIAITVNNTNDAPVNRVPVSQKTPINTPIIFSAATNNQIAVTDSDAGGSAVQVSLSTTNGSLSLNGTTGLTFTTGDGNADQTMTFTGTLANINTALNGMSFTPTTGFTGTASISLTTNDQGNTGGAALSDTDNVNVNVNNINSAPVVTIPVWPSVNSGQTLTFNSTNNTQLFITDPDAGNNPLAVTIRVTGGTFSLTPTAGVTITNNGTATVTATGTLANLNAALNNSQFVAGAGGPTPTVQIIVNDQISNNFGFTLNGPATNAFAGRSVSSAGDVNGDGLEDFIVGAPGSPTSMGYSYVVFGKTDNTNLNLSALGTNGFALNGEVAGDRNGFAVSSAGDVNGDGLDDLIVGAGLGTGDASSSGKTYLVFGKATSTALNLSSVAAGSGGFVIHGEAAADASGRSVSGAGDLNGDGYADLLVGSPGSDTTGANAGNAYVIYGGDLTASVTQQGTIAADILTGTAAADIIIGDAGDDQIIGNGGADVLIGGAGNDTLTMSDLTFRRMDGGLGTDTLALANLSLDLTTIRDPRIKGIEQIDLTTGNNTLTLNRLEILNLSPNSSSLRVFGNAGDVVNASGFLAGVTAGGFTTYTQAGATLFVQTGVTVNL